MIDWNKTTKEETLTISAIAKRAHEVMGLDILATAMDLTACHTNGCPLKLTELLNADLSNFSHDVCEIRRHIDRDTGQLSDCFVPRYAA